MAVCRSVPKNAKKTTNKHPGNAHAHAHPHSKPRHRDYESGIGSSDYSGRASPNIRAFEKGMPGFNLDLVTLIQQKDRELQQKDRDLRAALADAVQFHTSKDTLQHRLDLSIRDKEHSKRERDDLLDRNRRMERDLGEGEKRIRSLEDKVERMEDSHREEVRRLEQKLWDMKSQFEAAQDREPSPSHLPRARPRHRARRRGVHELLPRRENPYVFSDYESEDSPPPRSASHRYQFRAPRGHLQFEDDYNGRDYEGKNQHYRGGRDDGYLARRDGHPR